MLTNVQQIINIYNNAIKDYHIIDHIDQAMKTSFIENSVEYLLYKKCFIDLVQWHLEDIIRSPLLHGKEVLAIKRRIDESNQNRTNLVEQIDTLFFEYFKNIPLLQNAYYNTESIGWALDRLSILCIRIYHITAEANRTDATAQHHDFCTQKLELLLQQQTRLCTAIEILIEMIRKGEIIATPFFQVKMYNDQNLNPILYQ
ncbi:MAG: DUF4254 domain-containing protein [Chitinophagaceae bacterium]